MNSSDSLFLFPGAIPHSLEIEEWLSGNPPELFAIARQWFAVFRNCGDDVNELVHDGCPTACVGEAAFGYINVFSFHVNVGFFMGAFIDDPYDLLEGSGKRMRHVKLNPNTDTDPEILKNLINAAYDDMHARLHS